MTIRPLKTRTLILLALLSLSGPTSGEERGQVSGSSRHPRRLPLRITAVTADLTNELLTIRGLNFLDGSRGPGTEAPRVALALEELVVLSAGPDEILAAVNVALGGCPA